MSSILISAPSLRVNQQLTLSVCVSRSFKLLLLFLFLDGIEPFLAVISPCGTQQNGFLQFLVFAPKAQNLLPKIFKKSPISRLVWQIDRRCLGLPGDFWGWPIQWNHAKCCGADPCCHGNEIWARRGDPVAYRLVTTVPRRYCVSYKTAKVCCWWIVVRVTSAVEEGTV